MEVNKYTDIIPGEAAASIYEGRMVFLNSDGQAQLPASATQEALAKYVIAWPVEDRQLPIYSAYPTYTSALRQGWDQATNTPFSATVYNLYPNLSDEPFAIPSGNGALLFDKGEFTVTSGSWVYDATLAIGDELEVVYAAGDNQGKLQKKDSATAIAVCTGLPSGERLQFRTYGG